MHPGFIGWWKGHRHGCDGADFAAHFAGGHGHGHEHAHGHGRAWFGGGGDDGASFGVRRPLRFLAHKLELEDAQVERLATILSTLKTERAQAAVDSRRRVSAIADVVEAAALDPAKLAEIAAEQKKADERLAAAVAKALSDIHALLDAEQRKKLAYLLRTGVLTI